MAESIAQRQQRPALEAIWEALETVADPELPVSVVDLGMVYEVAVEEDGRVAIDLTFTSIGCPGMEMILEDIHSAVGAVPGVSEVGIEIVWSPPWTKERLTTRGRRLLMASGLAL